jgi:hypothetical protein
MAEVKLAPNNLTEPDTRAIALEGLRQAFQTRVGQIWLNVTMAGEANREKRFKEGFTAATAAYEQAWHAIDESFKA